MDPATLGTLIGALIFGIIQVIGKVGPDLLDKKLRDFLPEELQTTLEKRLADAQAEAKFGSPPANPYVPVVADVGRVLNLNPNATPAEVADAFRRVVVDLKANQDPPGSDG